MLFVVENKYTDHINELYSVAAIEGMAQSYLRGDHLFFIPRRVLENFINSKKFSEITTKILEDMFERAATSRSYTERFSSYIIIDPEAVEKFRETHSINGIAKETIRISPRELVYGHYLSPTVLVSEDHSDVGLFATIAQSYCITKEFGNVEIRYQSINGGGGNTHIDYMIRQKKEKRLTLCIVDSDKKFPSDNYGSTADKIIASLDAAIATTHFECLPVHEIENLIPLNALDAIVGERGEKRNAFQVIESIVNLENCDARRYIDMKKGMKLADIILLPLNDPYVEYWKPIAEFILQQNIIQNMCPRGKNCISREACSCVLIPPFGRAIYGECESEVRSHYRDLLTDWVDRNIIDVFMEIGKLVSDWCCGAERRLCF